MTPLIMTLLLIVTAVGGFCLGAAIAALGYESKVHRHNLFLPQGNSYSGIVTELRRGVLIIGAALLKRDNGTSRGTACNEIREIAKELDRREQHYRLKFEERPIVDKKVRIFAKPHEFEPDPRGETNTGLQVWPSIVCIHCGKNDDDDIHMDFGPGPHTREYWLNKTDKEKTNHVFLPKPLNPRFCQVCNFTAEFECHHGTMVPGICPECGDLLVRNEETYSCVNCKWKSGNS